MYNNYKRKRPNTFCYNQLTISHSSCLDILALTLLIKIKILFTKVIKMHRTTIKIKKSYLFTSTSLLLKLFRLVTKTLLLLFFEHAVHIFFEIKFFFKKKGVVTNNKHYQFFIGANPLCFAII
jgi:hypothetical protein